MGTKHVVQRSADADRITLHEAFEDYMQEKEAHSLSQPTLKNYRQSFDYLCQYNHFDEKTFADEVDQKAVFVLINCMKQKDVKPSSINHYLRDIRTFLYWCMDSTRGYIKPSFKVKEMEKQEEKLKIGSKDNDAKKAAAFLREIRPLFDDEGRHTVDRLKQIVERGTYNQLADALNRISKKQKKEPLPSIKVLEQLEELDEHYSQPETSIDIKQVALTTADIILSETFIFL